MLRRIYGAFLLVPALGLAALAQTTPDVEPESAVVALSPAGIDSVYARFSEAYRSLDADQIRSIYTPDCRYLPARSDIGVQTCEEAMAGFEAMFERTRSAAASLQIEFRFVDRSLSGDLAHDVGYYRLENIPPEDADGEVRISHGKFVTVLKRSDDGTWRIHVDGFSPAPAEAYETAEANGERRRR